MLHKIYRKVIMFPLISFIVIIVLALTIWDEMVKSHKDAIRENLALSGKITIQKLDLILQHNIESLEHLKMRIEFADGNNFHYWKNDAQLN